MICRYARALLMTMYYQRGGNLTLIGALALQGLVGEMTLPGAIYTVALETYMAQVLVTNLWQGACVLMDNLRLRKQHRSSS